MISMVPAAGGWLVDASPMTVAPDADLAAHAFQARSRTNCPSGAIGLPFFGSLDAAAYFKPGAGAKALVYRKDRSA